MSYSEFNKTTKADQLFVAAAGIRLLAKQESDSGKKVALENKAAKITAMVRQNAEKWSAGINNRNATISNGITLDHADNLSKAETEATSFWQGQNDIETIELIVNRYLKTAYVPFLPKQKETTLLDTI